MKLAIFGTVGAGKSTVSSKLSDILGWEVFPEPIKDNPYFDKYYDDMENNVFKMQIYMLTARSIQLHKGNKNKNVIFDRTILEDPIFVKVNHSLGTMNDIDYKTYNEFYENVIVPSIKEWINLDLVIYLKVSTETAIRRIKERGIEKEIEADYKYWEKLNEFYDEFYNKRKKAFNFIVIDANSDNLEDKINTILSEIKKLENNDGK